MKDKLEPNMYVRTKWGYICKIININDFREPNMKYGVEANYLKDVMFIGDDDVVKASYSIIDILEVGDIIRYRIDNIPLETKGYLTGVTDITDEEMLENIKKDKNYHVLQILAKEQMEKMAYKVGE